MKISTKPPFDQMLEMIAISIYELEGNYDKAALSLKEFEAFINQFEMQIYDQIILNTKASLARFAENFKAALKLHDQAIFESRQSVMTLNTLHVIDEFRHQKALTLFAAKMYQQSIEVLNMVLNRNPILGSSILLKAKALIELGQFEEAQIQITKVRTLWQNADPDLKELNELNEVEAKLLATQGL